MKILIISFSGTGNTTLCGKYLQKHFQDLGHEADCHIVKHDHPFKYNLEDYDLIGFGYPIHAFNVPEYFYKFIKGLPVLKESRKYFIFKVSGEPFHLNDASSNLIFKKLKKKGFELVGEKHFLMPYNIMFRYQDSIAKQMYLYLYALTKAYVIALLNNEAEMIKYKLRYKVLTFFLRIEWIAPKLNSPFIAVKKDKCNDCHLCINSCPTGAIYINKKGKIKTKASKCTMCMRCAMFCPKDAIRYGFMNHWKVNSPYPYEKIVKDNEIAPEYINHDTKGYFKHFNNYFDRQKALLEKYGIENPIEQYLNNKTGN